MRTPSGPVIKSTKTRDFKYSFLLSCYSILSLSIISALGAHLQSIPLTSKALVALCRAPALGAHLQSTPLTFKAPVAISQLMPSTSSVPLNQSHSVIQSFHTFSVPLPLRQEARIRSELRARAENLGQHAFWVHDPSGKPSGMLYILDYERQDWTSAFDGATLTQVLKRGDQCPRSPQERELTDS